MSEKQVYRVAVSLDMCVVASSAAEAERIAEDNYQEEVEVLGPAASARVPRIYTGEELRSIPWGAEGERRDWTVSQWVASRKAKAL